MSTCFIIRKSWFRNRWHVYAMGHLEGDCEWIASFASRADVDTFLEKVSAL